MPLGIYFDNSVIRDIIHILVTGEFRITPLTKLVVAQSGSQHLALTQESLKFDPSVDCGILYFSKQRDQCSEITVLAIWPATVILLQDGVARRAGGCVVCHL